MRENLQQIIEDNIDLAMSHGYIMIPSLTLCDCKGKYMTIPNRGLACHPLETVVLGQEIQGPVNLEIANNLGVHPSWIDGFIDGYADNKCDLHYLNLGDNDPLRKNYLEGFDGGKEILDNLSNLETSS